RLESVLQKLTASIQLIVSTGLLIPMKELGLWFNNNVYKRWVTGNFASEKDSIFAFHCIFVLSSLICIVPDGICTNRSLKMDLISSIFICCCSSILMVSLANISLLYNFLRGATGMMAKAQSSKA